MRPTGYFMDGMGDRQANLTNNKLHRSTQSYSSTGLQGWGWGRTPSSGM